MHGFASMDATSMSNHRISLLQDVVGSKFELQNQSDKLTEGSPQSRKRHHCWHRKPLNCKSLVTGRALLHAYHHRLWLSICVVGAVILYHVLGVRAI